MTPSEAEVWKLNAKYVAKFIDEKLPRKRYRAQHPTEVCVAGCMDGRLNFRALTRVPESMTEYRNIGGVFDLGWPAFDPVFAEWVGYAISRGRHNLLLVCYHYSASDPLLGCRGHGFERERAAAAAEQFARQVERVYGHGQVFPVLVGIETDEDNLLVHSSVGHEVLSIGYDVAPVMNGDALAGEYLLTEHFTERLRMSFPAMPQTVVRDFVPYLVGNHLHVRECSSKRSPEHLDHAEWLIGLGQGIHPWLTVPNTALLVNEFDPNLAAAIEKACGTVRGNILDGRTRRDPVLLVCAPFREEGPNLRRAIERVEQLVRFAREKVFTRVDAAFRERLSVMTAVMDIHTRRILEIRNGELTQTALVRSTLPPALVAS